MPSISENLSADSEESFELIFNEQEKKAKQKTEKIIEIVKTQQKIKVRCHSCKLPNNENEQ